MLKNILKFTIVLAFFALFISCNNAKTNKTIETKAEIKKGVAPIADNEVAVVDCSRPVVLKEGAVRNPANLEIAYLSAIDRIARDYETECALRVLIGCRICYRRSVGNRRHSQHESIGHAL